MTDTDDNYEARGFLPMQASSSDLARLQQELSEMSALPGNKDLLDGKNIPDKIKYDHDKLQKASIKPEHLKEDPIPSPKEKKPASPRKQ